MMLILLIILYIFITLLPHYSDSEKFDSLSPIKSEPFIVKDQIIIVGTVDGNLHAIDPSFQIAWTTSTGDPLTYAEYSDKSRSNPSHTAIPTLDGSIFLHEEEGMKKTSAKARIMTENTPFMTKDGLLFTGKKQSRVMGIDLTDGSVTHEVSTDVEGRLPSSPTTPPTATAHHNHHQHAAGGKLPKSSSALIGRIDYLLKATNVETGVDEFSISYSELIPLFAGMNHLTSQPVSSTAIVESSPQTWKRTRQQASDPSASPIAMTGSSYLLSNPNGGIMFYNEHGRALHNDIISLSSPAVNAFVISVVEGKPNFHFKLPIHYSLQNFRSFHKIKASSMKDSVHLTGKMNGKTATSGLLRSKEIRGSRSSPEDAAIDRRHYDDIDHLHAEDDEQLVLVQPLKKGDAVRENAIYGIEFSADALTLSDIEDEFEQKSGAPLVAGTTKEIRALPSPQDGKLHEGEKVIQPEGPVTNENENEEQKIIEQLRKYEQTKQLFSRHFHHPSLTLPSIKSSRKNNRPGPPLCTASNDGSNTTSSILICDAPSAVSLLSTEALNEITEEELSMKELHRLKNQMKEIRGIHKFKPFHYPSPSSPSFHHYTSSSSEKYLDEHSWLMNLLETSKQRANQAENSAHTQAQFKQQFQYQRPPTILDQLRLILEIFTLILVIIIALLFALEKTVFGKSILESLPLPVSLIRFLGVRADQHLVLGHKDAITGLTSPVPSEKSPVIPDEEVVEYVNGKKVSRIGSLYVSDIVLGYGSCGTVVFFGRLNGRSVAVKRMLSQFHKAADREISMLIKSDGHPNVVRYFLKEEKNDFVYLGLQLCEMTLKEFVTSLRNNLEESNASSTSLQVIDDEIRISLLQVAQGLAYLHARKIVHRDIKPHNILCASNNRAQDFYSPSNDPEDWLSSFLSQRETNSSKRGSSENNQDSSNDSAISSLRQLGNYVLKISDMGMSKQLDRDEHSFSSFSMAVANQHHQRPSNEGEKANNGEGHHNQHHTRSNQMPTIVGTIGWQAPELIRSAGNKVSAAAPNIDIAEHSQSNSSSNNRGSGGTGSSTTTIEGSDAVAEDSPVLTKPSAELNEEQLNSRRTLNVDVFSLGCVFYYTLTLGEHPFGDWYEREANIVTNKMNLTAIDRFPDAVDLITSMLHPDSSIRPSSVQVCHHPFFWTTSKRLEFLNDFSDRLEKESADSIMVLELERSAQQIIYGKWEKRLDITLLEDIGKYRKYDTTSVRDLLRLIRNKRHHYHELSEELKEKIGTIPTGFYQYFDIRFPLLFLHCTRVVSKFLSGASYGKEEFIINWQNTPSTSSEFQQNQLPSTNSVASPYSTKMTLLAPVAEKKEVSLLSPTRGGKDTNTTNTLNNITEHAELSMTDGEADIQTQQQLFSPFEKGATSDYDDSSTIVTSTTINTTYTAEQMADIIVWHGSTLQSTLRTKGWWRDSQDWICDKGIGVGNALGGNGVSSKKSRSNHLTKAATDFKYRTRLCTHWEATSGTVCPMRKKGKCIFAHGPLELRVKETRRDKWGKGGSTNPANNSAAAISPAEQLRFSGGEDTLNAARSIEKVRAVEGSFSEFERSSVYSNTTGMSIGAPPSLNTPPPPLSYMAYDVNGIPQPPTMSIPSPYAMMGLPPNVQIAQDPKTGQMSYYYIPPN